jgi:hypothetical protein
MKASFWTRPSERGIDFVHTHLFSFQPGFRVHVGFRALRDPFAAVALNGPSSGSGDSFDLAFTEEPATYVRCAAEIARYWRGVGKPWLSMIDGAPPTPSGGEPSPPEIAALVARSRSLLGVV